jgi:hypothetical protein
MYIYIDYIDDFQVKTSSHGIFTIDHGRCSRRALQQQRIKEQEELKAKQQDWGVPLLS